MGKKHYNSALSPIRLGIRPAAILLAISLPATAMAQFLVTENFNTDPANWLREGVQNGADGPDSDADSDGHNFGFSPTDNTGNSVAPPGGVATGAGEAGGPRIGKRSPASYGAPVGTLTLNNDLYASGIMRFDYADLDSMTFGWFNSAANLAAVPPYPFTTSPRRPQVLGFRQDARTDVGTVGQPGNHIMPLLGNPGTDPGAQFEELAFNGEAATLAGRVTYFQSHPFEIIYDADGGDGFGSLTIKVEGVESNDSTPSDFSYTVNLTEDQRNSGVTFDRFGILGSTTGSSTGGQTAWFDDLTFTSNVPEPASMAVLGIAVAGLALRRRRQVE